MIRRPPRSTLDRSSAASDVYKRQVLDIARPAMESMQRRWPSSGRGFELTDMNREWPGNENGFSAVSRQAGLVFNRLLKPNTDPVSYTHLRAHETVLDLVCRLLLEKTNNTKTNKDNK